jgi:hypothetical protein
LPETCRVIAVLGARPDAVELALVIQDLRRRSTEFQTAVVHMGQHRTMLDETQRQKGTVPMSGGLVLRLSMDGINPSGVRSERRVSSE